MSLPNETDLPDPPLDNSGELQLPPELIMVADRLRRESVRVAETVVPQAAAVPLLRHAANGGKRQTWRQVALGVAVMTFCASFLVIALILRHAADLARPLPHGSRPVVIRPVPTDCVDYAQRELKTNVFLTSDGINPSSNLERDLGAASDTLSPAQRIELLEHAVDVYHNALIAHRERIIELQKELDAALSKLEAKE